jgi:flagellar hook-associated protein 2
MVNSTGISFSGLASGLDTSAIIAQLVALERIPIQMLENQKAKEQSKLDKLDAFGTLVKSLKTAAEKVSTTDEFYAWTVNNSDAKIATIGATGGAQAGIHSLEALSLASVDRWAFDAVTDPNADLASADGEQLVFDIGSTQYSLTVNAASSSLNDIATAIDSMAGDVVTTDVVNTGTASNPQYRLVLASKDSGEDTRITSIVTDIAGLGITYSAPDASGNATSSNNLTVGANAQAMIDGLLYERSSNDFSDVYAGIEINLLSTTAANTPITFSVDPDKDGIRDNVDGFLTAYNAVIDFINQQSSFTPSDEDGEAGTSGALFGDSILRSVRSNVNRALFDIDPTVIAADIEGYSTLSLVGIKADNDGKLSLDSTVFDEKLSTNLELLADLFVDTDGFDNGGADPNTDAFYQDQTADSGLAASLAREIDRMFGTFEGPVDPNTGNRIPVNAMFDLKEDTIRNQMDRISDQVSTMERRLESFETNLVMRYARLESLMAGLNAQGSVLNSIFS